MKTHNDLSRFTARAGAVATAALLAFLGASALAAPERTCPLCRQRADVTWRYCPFDGTRLPEDSLQQPQPPAAPEAPAAAPKPAAYQKAPNATIDDLFKAIAAGNDAGVKACYRWEAFFADATPEELPGLVDDYVKRLGAKIRPSLEGRQIVPGDVRMSSTAATLQYRLKDRAAKMAPLTYEFDLTSGQDGWKIVAIRP